MQPLGALPSHNAICLYANVKGDIRLVTLAQICALLYSTRMTQDKASVPPAETVPKRDAWTLFSNGLAVILAILAGVNHFVRIIALLLHIPDSTVPVVSAALVIAAVLVVRRFFVFRWVYRLAAHASPILILILLAMTALIYATLRPHGPQPIIVKFDPTKGKLFSSWNDPYLARISRARIWVLGAQSNGENTSNWELADDYTAAFAFQADMNLDPKRPQAVSGAYMTFYDTPVDTQRYREFRFKAKMVDTEPGALPDVGVRLCVDSLNGQESAVYELTSLRKRYNFPLKPDWQSFTLDLNEFLSHARYSAAPDASTNRHTINKVVFFLGFENVSKCVKGKLWIQDITFQPHVTK